MGEINQILREIHIVGSKTRERLVHESSSSALRETGIVLCGTSSAEFGFQFERPSPILNQLLACCAGQGEVWLDGEWHLCQSGMAYLTPRASPHAYRAVRGCSWDLVWVQWAGKSGGILAPPPNALPTLLSLDPVGLHHAVSSLCQEALGAKDSHFLHLWAQIVAALTQRHIALDKPGRELLALWDRVEANLATPWTLQSLAKIAGMSPEHLRRLCLRLYGQSPLRQVTSMRMQRARDLLATGVYSVEYVAHNVGYGNAFAFSTAFKRHTGMSPREFRALYLPG